MNKKSFFGGSIEEYVVDEQLGKGGFATVHRARCLNTGISVAIKKIRKREITAKGLIERVRQEVGIHAQLSHPSILRLYTFFEDQDYVYLVLELCLKGDLQKSLKNNGRILPENEAREYLDQIVNGMLYLHSKNIIHRDLTLTNILLDDSGRCKIADFGLATLDHPDDRHTTMCGTPNYISPEVVTRRPQGPESDVWSLGCMLYIMLVGQPPFDSQGYHQHIFNRVVHDNYKVPDYLSDEARDLIGACLQKQPEDRIKLKNVPYHRFMVGSRGESHGGEVLDSGLYTMSTQATSHHHQHQPQPQPQPHHHQPRTQQLSAISEVVPGGHHIGTHSEPFLRRPPSPPVRMKSSPRDLLPPAHSGPIDTLKRKFTPLPSRQGDDFIMTAPALPHFSKRERDVSEERQRLHQYDREQSEISRKHREIENEIRRSQHEKEESEIRRLHERETSQTRSRQQLHERDIDHERPRYQHTTEALIRSRNPSTSSYTHSSTHSSHSSSSGVGQLGAGDLRHNRKRHEYQENYGSSQSSQQNTRSKEKHKCPDDGGCSEVCERHSHGTKSRPNSKPRSQSYERPHSYRGESNSRERLDLIARKYGDMSSDVSPAGYSYQSENRPGSWTEKYTPRKSRDRFRHEHRSTGSSSDIQRSGSREVRRDKAHSCCQSVHHKFDCTRRQETGSAIPVYDEGQRERMCKANSNEPCLSGHGKQLFSGSCRHSNRPLSACSQNSPEQKMLTQIPLPPLVEENIILPQLPRQPTPRTPTKSVARPSLSQKLSPLSSCPSLKTKRKLCRNYLSICILEGGDVCLEQLRYPAGKQQPPVVEEICWISPDGLSVVVSKPQGGPRFVLGNEAPARPEKDCRIFSYHTLPRKYWKKYMDAATFVKLTKSRTSKLKYDTDQGSFRLMQNSPDPVFSGDFFHGERMTKRGNRVVVEKKGRVSHSFNFDSDSSSVPSDLLPIFTLFKEEYSRCLEMDRDLSHFNNKFGVTTFTSIRKCKPVSSTAGTATNQSRVTSDKENLSPISATSSFSSPRNILTQLGYYENSMTIGLETDLQKTSPPSTVRTPLAPHYPTNTPHPQPTTSTPLPSNKRQPGPVTIKLFTKEDLYAKVEYSDGSLLWVSSTDPPHGPLQYSDHPGDQPIPYTDKNLLPHYVKDKLLIYGHFVAQQRHLGRVTATKQPSGLR